VPVIIKLQATGFFSRANLKERPAQTASPGPRIPLGTVLIPPVRSKIAINTKIMQQVITFNCLGSSMPYERENYIKFKISKLYIGMKT
jgi:hypothetical protein